MTTKWLTTKGLPRAARRLLLGALCLVWLPQCMEAQTAADTLVVYDLQGRPVLVADSTVRRAARQLASNDSTARQPKPKRTFYDRHRERYISRWQRLLPSQYTLQFAGSIGLLNMGLGWHYAKGHCETELLLGFVPRYHSECAKATFTLKQRYVPWLKRISRRWTLHPLTTGLAFNTISGDDFWKNEPDKYPKNYYGFSTKVRIHVFLGQEAEYHIPRSKRLLHSSVTGYYEIGTCDMYLISKVTNKSIPLREVLSLAFGLRFHM